MPMVLRSRRLALVIVALLSLVGCSASVAPPAAPVHPTTVYLCDYGYHSSLLLPVGRDGTFVEYLYGDWNWAALNHTGVGPVIQAALFSSGATLGRRYIYQPGLKGMPQPFTKPVTQLPIVVNGDRVDVLQQTLDRRWQAHSDGAVYDGLNTTFYVLVHDDQPYDWVHNCNRETADWLTALGCDIHGWPLLSHFTLSAGGTPPESKGLAGKG